VNSGTNPCVSCAYSSCCMLVSLLSTFLGFGADLLRFEVPASFRWINRLVSSQCITYFHRSKLSKFNFCWI
jgi:hypothetical protein